MTNFKYEFGRVLGKEGPLFPGQYALKIIESKKGQPFSQIIHELAGKLTDPYVSGLMNMQYILYMEVHNPLDEETFGDIKIGLKELDETSFNLRSTAAKTEEIKYRESLRRPYAYLNVKGIFDIENFAMSFDAVHVDVSKISEDELKNHIVNLVAVGNRTNPTTFTISGELANKLLDEEFGKTSLASFFQTKSIISKNIFAPQTNALTITNTTIRTLP